MKYPYGKPIVLYFLADVMPDTPAARGALKPGDIITRFNDRAVDTYRQLLYYTAATASGTTVTLSIIRGGSEQVVTVTLGAPPKDFLKPRVASKSVTLTVTNPCRPMPTPKKVCYIDTIPCRSSRGE